MATKSKGNKNFELRTQMGSLNIDGKIYPLYEGINTVGRNKDATVIVRDPSVSQQHAIITIVNENQRFVSDLRSFNGTIVEYDKLNPFSLCELPDEIVIHFAKCKALFRKVPSNAQPNNLTKSQETQSVSQSFYSAETQPLADVTTDFEAPTCNYFEDDYNFSDIPSPPSMQETDQGKKTTSIGKSNLSIHDMPTQLYCSDVVSDVVISAKESSKIGYEIITTKVDVHNLATQIICPEAAVNKSTNEIQSEISFLHDMPTQILENTSEPERNRSDVVDASNNKSSPSTSKNADYKILCNDTFNDSGVSSNSNHDTKRKPDVSLDIIEQSHLDDSDIIIPSTQIKNNVKEVEDTPSSSLDSNLLIKPIADDSEEVDSELDKVKKKRKSPSQPTNSEDSNSEEIGKQKKNCRVIDSDGSDTDIEDAAKSNSKSAIEFSKTKQDNRKKSALSQDSSSQEIGKQKKKCHVLDSDGSETDIEDLEDSAKFNTSKTLNENSPKILKENSTTIKKQTPNEKSTSRRNSSGSDTDIGELEIPDKILTALQNDNKTNPATLDINKFKKNESDSDTDEDDFEFGVKNKATQKLDNTLNKFNVIPTTQISKDDSDDDFNFMPEINSTVVAKDSSEPTKQPLFDVSQKLAELRKASLIPQNCSEESFRLGLSESSEKARHSEELVADNKNEDDDRTPDLSDVDEPIAGSEDVSNKSTQKNNKADQDIFEMATQKIAGDTVTQTETNKEIFATPMTSKCFANIKHSESAKHSQDPEDDIFMQATQPVITNKDQSKEEVSNASAINEDIFLQPTQKYEVDKKEAESKADGFENDIFMQQTQKIVVTDSPTKSEKNQPGDDIFMQPSQQIILSDSATKSVLSNNNQPADNIFLQETQKLEAGPSGVTKDHSDKRIFDQPTQIIELNTSNSKSSDDIFMQATQQIILSKPSLSDSKSVKTQAKDIFMEPTQVISVESETVTKPVEVSRPTADNNDPFNETTQQLGLTDESSPVSGHSLNKVLEAPRKQSLSLRKGSTKRTKFDDVESQLEVMFASQTLRMSSQANSRPSNPLVNVLDQNSEDLKAESEDPNLSESDDISDSLKEYCTMPTLPMDEVTDFQTSSSKVEEKTNNKTRRRGRPSKESSLISPHKTSVLETPRKRGRPKGEVVKTTCDIPETSRKLRGNRVIDSDETEFRKSKEKVDKIQNKQESIPTTSSKQPEDENKSVIVSQDEDKKELKKTSEDKSDEDSEEEILQENVKKQLKTTNLKRSTRIERTNKKTDNNDSEDDILQKNAKKQLETTNLKRSTRAKRTNTVTDNTDSEEEILQKNVKKQLKTTNLKRSTKIERINKKTDNTDSEEDLLQKNAKNQLETTNLKRSTRAKRANTETDNTDEGKDKSKNSKNSNSKKNKLDDNLDENNRPSTSKAVKNQSICNIQDSKNEENNKEEVMTNRTRTKNKTNFEPLNLNKKTRNSNVSKGQEENENKPVNARATRSKKQESLSTTSTEIKDLFEEGQKLKTSDVQVITLNSDSDSEDLNIQTTPVKRRKVNNKQKTTESEVQKEASTSTNIVSTANVKSNKTVPKRIKSTNQDNSPSTGHKSSASNIKRSKRLLSRDSDASKAESIKKIKTNEASENEDVESISDNSEINFRTPRKTASLNVTPNTVERNKRKQKPKVVFTMLNSPELESLVRRLGGTVVDSVSACTVLVTGSLKRSQKLLSAVGEGKPICSPTWLQECKKANQFLDAWDYILEDEEAETKWNFTLKESLNRSRNKRLLEEFTVVLNVTEAVDVLKAAVESCGGKCVMKTPPKKVETNLVIVANPSKKATYSKFLKRTPLPTIVAPEAIFDGVLRQEMNWKDHILS